MGNRLEILRVVNQRKDAFNKKDIYESLINDENLEEEITSNEVLEIEIDSAINSLVKQDILVEIDKGIYFSKMFLEKEIDNDFNKLENLVLNLPYKRESENHDFSTHLSETSNVLERTLARVNHLKKDTMFLKKVMFYLYLYTNKYKNAAYEQSGDSKLLEYEDLMLKNLLNAYMTYNEPDYNYETQKTKE